MERFVPDSYYKSIFDINYSKLKEKGITMLLFDLDNTIEPFNIKTVDEKTIELFKTLTDFKVLIYSNSPRPRVERFAKILDIEFVSNARKPKSKKFIETLKKYHKNENEVAMIGDQLNTDIQGGNNVGIYTIFVDPISSYDPIWTKIYRKKEKRILAELRRLGLFRGKHYDEKV